MTTQIEAGIQKSTESALNAARTATNKAGPGCDATSPLFSHNGNVRYP